MKKPKVESLEKPKVESLETLEILETLETVEKKNEPIKEPIKEPLEVLLKVKKPRSQKQIDAFKNTLMIRQQKRDERKEIKTVSQEVRKVDVEKKILKKAMSIKKKEILQDLMLDDIEEDNEIPLEIVKKILKKYPKKKVEMPNPISRISAEPIILYF
tara:strand:- start:3577 stop:4050 length:474 start_codon:yes stop_codon:yes gene_type:complete